MAATLGHGECFVTAGILCIFYPVGRDLLLSLLCVCTHAAAFQSASGSVGLRKWLLDFGKLQHPGFVAEVIGSRVRLCPKAEQKNLPGVCLSAYLCSVA